MNYSPKNKLIFVHTSKNPPRITVTMKALRSALIAVILTAFLVEANLGENETNELDGEQIAAHRLELPEGSRARVYSVKKCNKCPAHKCQVLGEYSCEAPIYLGVSTVEEFTGKPVNDNLLDL